MTRPSCSGQHQQQHFGLPDRNPVGARLTDPLIDPTNVPSSASHFVCNIREQLRLFYTPKAYTIWLIARHGIWSAAEHSILCPVIHEPRSIGQPHARQNHSKPRARMANRAGHRGVFWSLMVLSQSTKSVYETSRTRLRVESELPRPFRFDAVGELASTLGPISHLVFLCCPPVRFGLKDQQLGKQVSPRSPYEQFLSREPVQISVSHVSPGRTCQGCPVRRSLTSISVA